MIVRSLTAAFLLLLILLAILAAGVLGSDAGSRLILGWVERQLEPRLSVSGLGGSLLSDLCAEHVRYEQPGVHVTVEDVCVEANLWSSIDFLHVSLQSLTAASVLIETLPAEADPDGGGEFHLPIVIGVESFRIATLSVNGVELVDLDGALELSNANVASTSSFSFADHRVTLRTGGPWEALRAEVGVLEVRAELVANVLDATLPYRLTASTPALDLEPYIGRSVRLADVGLSGTGDLNGYRFDVDGRVADPAAVGGVRASGRGDWSDMALTSVRLSDVTLEDVPVALEEVTGRAHLDWRGRFTLLAEGIQGRGDLQGRQARAEVPLLRIDGDGVEFQGAAVRLFHGGAAGVVRLDGSVGSDLTMDLHVDADRVPLGSLAPELNGVVSGGGTVTGTAARPVLAGQVTLDDIRYRGQHLKQLVAQIDGPLREARIVASASHAEGDLTTTLTYRLDDDGMVATIDALEGRLARTPAGVRLLDPTRIRIGDDRVQLPETCLGLFGTDESVAALDDARLCLGVDYPDGGLDLDLAPWTLPELQLPAGGVTIRGTAVASARLSSFAPVTGSARVELFDLQADHEGGEVLDLGRILAAFTVDDRRIRAELHTPTEHDQELALHGTLSSELAEPLAESTLGGEVSIQLDGIWAAQSLLPMDVTYELAEMRGVMGVRASVGGTLGHPVINGALVLDDVGARVLALNARFSDFDAEARLANSQTISFSSQGAVGAGALAITGELEGLDTNAPRLETRFRLDGAEVVNLPDYTAAVSGDFTLGMGSTDLSLAGDLTLDRADIRIADLPESAVSPSPDEVLVGEGAVTPTQQIRTTDVSLTLGRKVHLEAFGLKARLVGSLRLEEAPRRLQSVTGTISLRDGEFEAYGQVLEVERGRLTFTGAVDNPTVDVQATKVVTFEERDYKISLLISGTAKDLVTTIRSQPALAEDDALALLLTGKTISQISDQERSNVDGAAISMGLLNAMGVTQNLASRLNLEEIIIEQDDEGNMEYGAAVRLNRDFYLRYTYGVFSRLGGVLLRYRLNTRLSVQAKTGDAHSIEIRYGVD